MSDTIAGTADTIAGTADTIAGTADTIAGTADTIAGTADEIDVMLPRRQVDRLPAISAETYQHVGRYAGAVVMSVFEQIGGIQRMANWADENPTDFYTKLLPKMIQRSQSVDVSGSITIDDAITRLESNVIDGNYEEVLQYDL
jgi:hypothetical protein